MKNIAYWTGAFLLISLTLLNHPAPAVTPPLKLADYVTSYDLAEPKLFWYTRPICNPTISGAAEDSDFAEIIRRVPTYGGLLLWRTLYYDEVDSTCTQQVLDVRSNLIADENYVYWMSHSFGGIVRLSVNANQGDLPELLSDDVSGYSELAHDTGRIFVLTDSAEIWNIAKTNGDGFRRVADAGPNAYNLQTDGKYIYWITNGTLKRHTPSGLYIPPIPSLASGVTGYHPEGPTTYLCGINPIKFCPAEYVFIAQGNKIIRYNNLDRSTTTTIYTSSDSSALIYSLASNPSLLTTSGVYFLESRRENCGQLFCNYKNHLIRTGRGGGTVSTLYITTSSLPNQKIANSLRANYSHLFWEELGGLWRLPMDAEPIDNMRITNFEITQGIQDLYNSVMLIQNRRTFVRLHVESADDSISGVTAYLYRINSRGVVIDGPLVPVNPVGPQITVQTNPNRANLNDSFLFELPWNWTTDSLRLKAVLNPNQIPIETNFTDNSANYGFFYFQESPRLEVQFVSWGYILNNKYYYPRLVDDVFQAYSWIRRTYPLASTPGNIADPSPGFRPNLWIVADEGLGSRVNQTHPDCLKIEKDYRNLCASAYTNTMMDAMRAEYGVPSSRFMYGMISDEAGFFPRGQACCGEKVSSGPVGTPNIDHWDDDTSYGDWYAAHEIGHTLGRGHPSENSDDPATENKREGCGHDAADPYYPYIDAHIGPADGSLYSKYGFDAGDPAFGLPFRIYPDVSWYDVMSYCAYEWISDYTYKGMYDFMMLTQGTTQSAGLQEDLSPAIQGDFLSVYGLIYPNRKTATITRLRKLIEVVSIPPYGEGYYSIRLLNNKGGILTEYLFNPAPVYDFDETVLSFGQIVDFVNGTRKVQIYDIREDKVLAENLLSAHAPIINNVHLVGILPNPVSGIVTLAWDASDADDDPLVFDIFYSRDNGASFMPLKTNVTGSSTQIDTALLGGASAAILRVVASDGVHSAAGQTASFAMADKPPDVFIVVPQDGLQVQYGQLVNFVAEAIDLQGDIAPLNMSWSNQYGGLGLGPMLSVTDLPVGENVIVFTAVNSAMLAASDSITVYVSDDLTLPGPTLSVGPQKISWHVDAGSSEIQQAAISINNGGSGTVYWQADEDAPWLSISAASGTAPTTLVVTANPAPQPDGTIRSALLTIETTSPAGQSVTIPVNLSKGDVWRDTGNLGVDLKDMANELGRTDCYNDCEGNFDYDVDVDGADIIKFIQASQQ